MSISKLGLLLTVIAATCLGAATAHATSTRTWVSNAGNDSNPCSVTQPCLTFAGALANTSSGGEINCLNAGGFGTVTIGISVTIDCEGVSNGGITVTGDVAAAITINTAGTTVNLIGLDLNGVNGTGGFGVNITAAATVTVRNCKIYGFQEVGIQFTASGGSLVVDNVLVTDNSYLGIGIFSGGVANMTVRNSTVTNNGYGIAVQDASGTHAGGTIEQTTVAFNGHGLSVDYAGAVALIGGSTVVNNGTGVTTSLGGTVYSFKDSQIGGNSADGTPLTAYPGGPLN